MVPIDEIGEEPAGSRWRPALIALGAIALTAALLYGILKPAPPTGIVPGAPAPGFDLPVVTLEGQLEGSLSLDELKGSVVVLNFWWSGCDPCREEAPILDRTWREHRDEGVVVVGVDVERDSPAAAADFARAFGMSYPIVRDTDGSLARSLRINDRFLPQTFFIDREGNLAQLHVGDVLTDGRSTTVLGPLTRAVLEKQIKAMLAD
ncbi:MAG: TlpA family protein disulfide reductase [Actinomycetota bacterium]|nr:TlpA family protein disulfide reductase [Actinomycetota bacterium]